MSLILSAPTHSFIQLAAYGEPTGCAAGVPLCLPVRSQLDLAFQLIARVSGADKDWFEVDTTTGEGEEEVTTRQTIWGRFCTECADLTGEEPDLPTTFAFTGTWRKVTEASTDIWVGNFQPILNIDVINAIETGACLHICFYKITYDLEDTITATGINVNLVACTDTCFNKIADDCFTSRFIYGCNEDSFGFIYTDTDGDVNFTNAVRLPCHLRGLQMPGEEKSYIKSDGSKVKLFERIDEEYEMIVDFIPKPWHIALKVLLANDTVQIQNVNETGTSFWQILCKEKYEINWPEYPYALAPAKTKVVRAEALSLINSNCNP